MKTKMKYSLIALFSLIFSILSHAQEPAEVMLLGTFHFKDSGKDVVKVADVDIFSEASQAYLETLTDRLAAFDPSVVLLEYNPESEARINERYKAYLKGEYELPANEIYQLGFRIAKKAGLDSVKSFDHRDLHWAAQPMFDYAEEHGSPEMDTFNEVIATVTAEEKAARASMDLQGLLRRSNDPERDRTNMDLYLATNAIGVDDGWSGADATATWWQRNFRMYANIQKAAKPGGKIIAIGGSGHMAILKELLRIDKRLQAVPPLDYL